MAESNTGGYEKIAILDEYLALARSLLDLHHHHQIA